MKLGKFPYSRPRRNRKSEAIRNLLAEVNLSANDFVLPIFVHSGDENEAVSSMPDVFRYSIKNAVEQVKLAQSLGINAIAPFPKTDDKLKCELGKESYNNKNLICQAIAEIKSKVPEVAIFADVALDPYTTHGHDGVLDKAGNVDNDASVEILCKQALVLAQAGADVIAPSDMMDGRVGDIRKHLDEAGHMETSIMSYTAKYSSSFYGPFRDAVGSGTKLKTASKDTYQMDFRNNREAELEFSQDIAEGADMLMVKPAMPYLDIIKTASAKYNLPILAYQVSGEYSSLKAADQQGYLSYEQTMLESLTSIKRAGARAIFTYAAIEMAKLLEK